MTDPIVRRLHECLDREIRQREIVPYRAIRSEIGVEMNADYEHALLRLLAGEDGLVRLEPPEARDELRIELEMPDPNVTLYREFAGCDVWVTAAATSDQKGRRHEPAAQRESHAGQNAGSAGTRPLQPATVRGARGAAAPNARTAAAAGRDTPDAPLAIPEWLAAIDRERPSAQARAAPPPATGSGGAPAAARSTAPPSPPRPGTGHSAAPAAARAGTAPARRPAAEELGCYQCGGRLPGGRRIRYCPHCGADQERVPCGACGEILEASWRYCIACGAPA